MFDEFDKYILAFASEDFSADYWYDEGTNIAEKMLYEFGEDIIRDSICKKYGMEKTFSILYA
ncbi:MAG: hypothetical protein HFH95_14925 [Lachnospiraceae bacterium]|jgi:hypothetical protein|nr:hypothetical protein [uncultured Acetatifactor sp.]MCI8544569.1 hypothetical protein [Lachnospiraceae bacterium]